MLPTRKDRYITKFLTYAPQHFLSAIMYRLARSKWPPFKKLLIEEISHHYNVDIFDAKNPHLDSYPSFNAFFTRELKPDARTICKQHRSVVSPADGKVSQTGTITNGRLLQAKGHDFSLLGLLAGDAALYQEFTGGKYTTIYLSPKDYHRVHMPLTGRLREMHFVPGQLFSVSEATTQLVPDLFARNERVITVFDTAYGPMAVILVGAIFVGSMETVWHGEVDGPKSSPSIWYYKGDQAVTLKKGQELGRFNMGSTVILLFPKDKNKWEEALKTGVAVKMGQKIGNMA